MENQNLRITSKRLGLINLDKYCPRCFWWKLKLRWRAPFSFFGGAIFKNMEVAQMAVVGHMLNASKCLPKDFAPFTDIKERIDYPRHWSKYKYLLKSGTELYGEPDDIFKLADGSLAVIDHKTAQPKGANDPLLPCYQIQVLGYSLIAEKGLNLGKVTKGGLFYWAADYTSVVDDPEAFYRNKQLWMPFTPKPLPIEIDYKLLDSPLKEAEKVWKAKFAPKGAQNCEDCERLEALLAIESQLQKQSEQTDQMMLRSSGDKSHARAHIYQRRFDENTSRSTASRKLADDISPFDPAGVIANWEGGFEDGL